MQIQVLIPSQNQRSLTIQVDRNETVASFRQLISKTLKLSMDAFLLIALGKIMIDYCSDKTPATLFSTYRVKDKTCVFVHLIKPKRKAEEEKKPTPVKKKRRKTSGIIRDINVVSLPFNGAVCPVCHNDKKKKTCPECGCVKCLLKTGDPLICDQCNEYWHLHCAGITKMPTEQYWYCPDCKNNDHTVIIGKGKAMESTKNSPQTPIQIHDNECILVPSWYAGKIPGIYCGQSWESRALMYEWGMHRSGRNAVCGSVYTGAVSLVLTNGHSLERDVGYEFIYKGLSEFNPHGNHAYDKQFENQSLSRSQLALAKTCDAELNTEKGAKANRWRMSRPVRVCRASTIENVHPMFAPEVGYRYDGLYKLVKYWSTPAVHSNKRVWKFLFRRDDQEAPPWTAAGRGLSTKRGLRMIRDDPALTEKRVRYMIPSRIQRLMSADRKNKRLWDQVKKMEFWSEYECLHYLFDQVVVCSSNACTKPIKDPITTPCGHLCCIKCLTQSDSDRCFTCRAALPSKMEVNQALLRILKSFHWAYDTKPPVMSKDVKTEDMEDTVIKKEFCPPELERKTRVIVKIEYLGNLYQQDNVLP